MRVKCVVGAGVGVGTGQSFWPVVKLDVIYAFCGVVAGDTWSYCGSATAAEWLG